MKKGFTLIELILYISLFSIIMISVFGFLISQTSLIDIEKSNVEIIYEKLIRNYHVK